MNWLFNSDKFDFKGNEKESLSWEQARNFLGRIDDRIIFFRNSGGIKAFISLYTITNISSEPFKFNNLSESRIRIQFELILKEKYSEPKEFSNYIYSFQRVKYFEKYLYRHFNKRYYRLSVLEFNAINDDKIFVSRTVLGIGLNALQINHRKAFSRYLVQRNPESLQNIYKYDKILELFKEYLEFAILIPARQLLDASRYLQEIVTSEIYNEIGFLMNNEKENKSNLIQSQVKLIDVHEKKLTNTLRKMQQLSSETIENIFNKKFTNKPLPIDLT